MNIELILCLLISFTATLALLPWWIRKAKNAGLFGYDMHKNEKPRIAEAGGLIVIIGFLIGLLLYTGHRTFVQHNLSFNVMILGVVSTILLLALIGLVDDILGWKIGLRQWQKPILCIFAAMPMAMINAGIDIFEIPGIGEIKLGVIYPIIIIPLAIAFCANAYNMLGGYNGLEAGMGIIILTTLGLVTWLVEGKGEVAMIAFTMVMALLAFLLFNWYPARVFPGDTLTYSIGGLIAIIAILGNAEKIALILFLPYIIEFFLKALGGWKHDCFVEVKGKKLIAPKKDYSLTHIAVKVISWFKEPRERDVTVSLMGMEIIIVGTAVLILL